eukprot:7971-Heterococcus_DN1.PRE.3
MPGLMEITKMLEQVFIQIKVYSNLFTVCHFAQVEATVPVYTANTILVCKCCIRALSSVAAASRQADLLSACYYRL